MWTCKFIRWDSALTFCSLFSDEIFMPKSEGDIENGDMDEVEKELEEFKR